MLRRKISSIVVVSILILTVFATLGSSIGGEDVADNTGLHPITRYVEDTWIDDIGFDFAIEGSPGANVKLSSSESVHVTLDSIPDFVSIHIEAACEPTSTLLSLEGLPIDKEFFRYQDGRWMEDMVTDGEGTLRWTQDLLEPHHVSIQAVESTIYIRSDGTVSPDTAPIDVSADLKTYTLTDDVEDTIMVQRPDITLDGAGYIMEPPSYKTEGVYMYGVSGVTVSDLVIRNVHYGVYAGYCDNILIEGCDISTDYTCVRIYSSDFVDVLDNTISGSDDDASGISFMFSDDGELSGNKISDGGGYGIITRYATSCLISQNEVSNKRYGIKTDDSYHFVLEKNTICGNEVYGIMLSRSEFFTLSHNTMTDNYQNFGVYGQSYSSYIDDYNHDIDTSNTVNGKPIYYYFDQGVVFKNDFSDAGYVGLIKSTGTVSNADICSNFQGVILVEAHGTIVKDSQFTACQMAIYVYMTDDCEISGNTICDGGYYGIYAVEGDGGIIKNNKITNTYDASIKCQGFDNCQVKDNVIIDGDIGIEFIRTDGAVVTGNSVSNQISMGLWFNGGSNIQISENVVRNSHWGFYLQYLIDSQILWNEVHGVSSTGIRLDNSEDCVIESNLVSASGGGLQISYGKSLTLLGNSMVGNSCSFSIRGYYPSGSYDHSIDTTNTIDGKSIYYFVDVPNVAKTDFSDAGYIGLVRSGATVSNAVISNVGQGVLIVGSPDTIVKDCQFTSVGTGIFLDDSPRCTIEKSVFINNGGGKGIHLLSDSDDCIIKDCTITSFADGIYIYRSTTCTMERNSLIGNDEGINVYYMSPGCKMVGNTLTGNLDGINIAGAQSCILEDNIIEGIRRGVTLRNAAHYTEMTGNVVSNHEEYGLKMEYVTGCVLKENVLNNNLYNLFIQESSYSPFSSLDHSIDTTNTVNGKTVYYYNTVGAVAKTDFSDAGFIAFVKSSGTIKNAILSHNSHGIILFEADGTTVADCTASSNWNGIKIFYSPGCTIGGNVVNSNAYESISMYNSEDSYLKDNSLKDNAFGIYLKYCDGSVVETNSVQNTLDDDANGIEIQYSDEVKATYNTIIDVAENGIFLHRCDDAEVKNNNVMKCGYRGIYLYYCSYATVSENLVKDSYYGFSMFQCPESLINGNLAKDNEIVGLSFSGSNSVIKDNLMSSNRYGISISGHYMTISSNKATKNSDYGFYLNNVRYSNIQLNTATSNQGPGFKTRYTKENTYESNKANDNSLEGFRLGFPQSDILKDNEMKGNDIGLWIGTVKTEELTVTGNKMTGNNEGIHVYLYCSKTLCEFEFSDNQVKSNTYGIYIEVVFIKQDVDITITGNEVDSNDVGLYLVDTYSIEPAVSVYQNNFNKNTDQIDGDVDVCAWDDGAGHGNYWSDYGGLDDGSDGRTAGDGIGDTGLPHQGVDYYPYMKKDGWV